MTNPDIKPLGTKVQPFWLETATALSPAQISRVLAQTKVIGTLPGGTTKELDVAGTFTVEPVRQGDREGLAFTPIIDALHDLAVVWCQAMAALPPKSLPRSQRPMVKILQRLTPKPTGNPAIDQGRRMLLDGTVKSLWVPITSTLASEFSKIA